jgi:4-hydroxy-tetrahydrodipicolinate synthase
MASSGEGTRSRIPARTSPTPRATRRRRRTPASASRDRTVAPVGRVGVRTATGGTGRGPGFGPARPTAGSPGTVLPMRPHGTYPTLPTVLHDDGTLDLDGQRRWLRRRRGRGGRAWWRSVSSTGEVDDLSPDEQVAVVRGRPRRGERAAGGRRARAPAATCSSTRSGWQVPARTGSSRRSGRTAADDAARRGRRARAALVAAPPPGRDRCDDRPRGCGARVAALARLPSSSTRRPRPTWWRSWAADGPLPRRSRGLFLPEELEAGAVGTTAGGAVVEQVVEVVARLPRRRLGPPRRVPRALAVPAARGGQPGPAGPEGGLAATRGDPLGARPPGAPLGTATKRAVTRRLRDVGRRGRLNDPYPGA